jgi:hypothetical protein
VTDIDWANVLTTMTGLWPRHATKLTYEEVNVWRTLFDPHPCQRCQEVLRELAMTTKFFPRPSEVREKLQAQRTRHGGSSARREGPKPTQGDLARQNLIQGISDRKAEFEAMGDDEAIHALQKNIYENYGGSTRSTWRSTNISHQARSANTGCGSMRRISSGYGQPSLSIGRAGRKRRGPPTRWRRGMCRQLMAPKRECQGLNLATCHTRIVAITEVVRYNQAMMRFGDQIRRAIETCGMTRYRLSKLSGIPQSTLSRFMAGKSMTTEVLDQLADVLGLCVTIRDTHKAAGRGAAISKGVRTRSAKKPQMGSRSRKAKGR